MTCHPESRIDQSVERDPTGLVGVGLLNTLSATSKFARERYSSLSFRPLNHVVATKRFSSLANGATARPVRSSLSVGQSLPPRESLPVVRRATEVSLPNFEVAQLHSEVDEFTRIQTFRLLRSPRILANSATKTRVRNFKTTQRGQALSTPNGGETQTAIRK